MAKRPITIQLEPTLIRTIDEARGQTSRQAWIADACRQRLDFDEYTGAAVTRLYGTFPVRTDERMPRGRVAVVTDEPLAPGDERETVASVSDGLALDAAMTRARRLRSSQQAKAGTKPIPKGK